MTDFAGRPEDDEFELALFGPGYGECIVMHIGCGEWIIVDSCIDFDEEEPIALRYLEDIGIKPADSVAMVVVTHWHDDHIRGLARIMQTCPTANFCCAAVLRQKEFLAQMEALEGNHFSSAGSGLREIHDVLSLLLSRKKKPIYALSNRLVFKRDACRLWALSPGDRVFQTFLMSVKDLIPNKGENKTRIPSLSPNEASVVLWVECGRTSLLLGADLDIPGWVAILEDSTAPTGKSSVFKIPHHGSKNANEQDVWEKMLENNPVAVLTPWQLGGRSLPTPADAKRILTATPDAWVTNGGMPKQFNHKNKAVRKTLQESRVRFRSSAGGRDLVRLRRTVNSGDQWTVELFGRACHLVDFGTPRPR